MSSRVRSPWSGTDRAVTPIVAKAIEAGIVVAFIGVLTTGLYAGVVPEYRSATAADVGDRTVVAAGNEIERAVPPDAERVHVETSVDLPETIRSERYRLVAVDPRNERDPGALNEGNPGASNGGNPGASNGGDPATSNGGDSETPRPTPDPPRIVLDHPHPAVGGSYTLALPDYVTEVRGAFTGGDGRIVIGTATDGEGLVVTLEDGR